MMTVLKAMVLIVNPSLIEFPGNEANLWQIVNDGVMGGLSRGTWTTHAQHAEFKGLLSLENNGGFSSVRRMPQDLDTARALGFVLRVKGDGRTYQFRLRTNDGFDGIAYRAQFKTQPNHWIEIYLPIAVFKPVYRGRVQANAPPLQPNAIRQLGFLIAGKQAGPFSLQVASIDIRR